MGALADRRRAAQFVVIALLIAGFAASGCGANGEDAKGERRGEVIPPVAQPELSRTELKRNRRRRAADGRPNVIVIVTDDQESGTVSKRVMPNTVRLLRKHGTSFANFVITSPLCCPSRAGLLTGQYGHNNGVLANKPGYPKLRNRANVLPAWLGAAGYETAHVGKYLNGYRQFSQASARVGPGWKTWFTLISDHYYDYNVSVQGKRYQDQTTYATKLLNDRVDDLIQSYATRSEPFYLQVDHIAPHSDSKVRGRCRHSAVGARQDRNRFEDLPLPKTHSFNESNVKDKPSFIRNLPRLSEQERGGIANRYRCRIESLPAVDRGVRSMVETLRKTGQLDNTVIFFYSDNGFFSGQHRLAKSKGLPYEESVRVPLLARVPPSLRTGGRVAKTGAPTSNIDLTATILDLAESDPCPLNGRCRTLDGISLMPLIDGSGDPFPRDRDLLIELLQSPSARAGGTLACDYQGIRTAGRELFVEYTSILEGDNAKCQQTNDTFEHYKTAEDPFQLRNLYPPKAGSRLAARERNLAKRLAELENCSGIKGRDQRDGNRPFCG